MTLDGDVAAAVALLQRERGVGVSEAVNELVRRGLLTRERTAPFRQVSSRLGVPLLPVDDVGGLLEALDGPATR